ncbi:uncharacterized protein LOC144884155 [Branchiostoma floridae x Branchiostoma japonicum]
MDRAERGLSPWQHDIRDSGPPATISSVSLNPLKYEGHPVEQTCRQCGQSFDSNQTLLNHVHGVHQLVYGPTREASAGETSAASSSVAVLSALSDEWNQGTAALYVIPEEEHAHACSHCGEKFESRSKLTKHVRSLHQRMRCTICGLELSNRFNHDRHVKMKHTSQRDFACVVCAKTFKRSDHLQRHMQNTHPSWWQ